MLKALKFAKWNTHCEFFSYVLLWNTSVGKRLLSGLIEKWDTVIISKLTVFNQLQLNFNWTVSCTVFFFFKDISNLSLQSQDWCMNIYLMYRGLSIAGMRHGEGQRHGAESQWKSPKCGPASRCGLSRTLLSVGSTLYQFYFLSHFLAGSFLCSLLTPIPGANLHPPFFYSSYPPSFSNF